MLHATFEHHDVAPDHSNATASSGPLRRLLVERRRQLLREIQRCVREVRQDAAGHAHPSTHPDDTFDAEPSDDLLFTMIQMKSELVDKIDHAVRRLDDGRYGRCGDCQRPIEASRLRAMPFAVRCRLCEERRELGLVRRPEGRHRLASELRRPR